MDSEAFPPAAVTRLQSCARAPYFSVDSTAAEAMPDVSEPLPSARIHSALHLLFIVSFNNSLGKEA